MYRFLGVKGRRTVSYVLLYRHYIPWLVLSCQFDIGHCSDVIRRAAEKSRRRRSGGGRSDQGEYTVNSDSSAAINTLVDIRKRNKRPKTEKSGGKLTKVEWRNARRERETPPNIRNRLRTFRAKATTCSPVKTEGLLTARRTTAIEKKWVWDRRPSRVRTANIRTLRAWVGKAGKREKYATVSRRETKSQTFSGTD